MALVIVLSSDCVRNTCKMWWVVVDKEFSYNMDEGKEALSDRGQLLVPPVEFICLRRPLLWTGKYLV